MCGCIELPRTGRDCKACDLYHWEASACDLPIAGAVRQPQHAPVVRDIEITAARIKRDARGGEVWERRSSQSIEIRPCRRARTLVIRDGKHVARRCRRDRAVT